MPPNSLFNHPLAGHLQAVLAGALVTLSLAPFNYWPLGIISMAWLAMLMRQLSPGRAALRGWFYGLGLFGTGTSWVYVSIHTHGNAPVILATFLTLLFTLGLGLFIAIPSYFYSRFIRSLPLGKTLGFATFWVLAEWLRSWLLTGFPWLLLGYGHLSTPLAGWAPIAGVMSISFIVALTGALLSEYWCQKKQGTQPNLLWIAAITTVIGWALGPLFNIIEWTKPTGQTVSVALVQSNIPQSLKWLPSQYRPTLSLYEDMSAPLWAEHDIVIWPEAAIPGFYQKAKPFLNKIAQTANTHNSTLITGLPTAEVIDQRTHYYNSVMAFGNGQGLYHKQRLVPFGEYVPLENLLRGLIDFFDLPMSSFSRGPARQPLLEAGNIRIAPSVCYEVVYGGLISAQVPEADLLLTVSNDAWFGESIGPLQHLEMAQMRALESGRYLIRATGNGVSALVNERGQLLARSRQFEQEVLTGNAKVLSGATPFAQTGPNALIALCFVLLAALSSVQRFSRISNKA